MNNYTKELGELDQQIVDLLSQRATLTRTLPEAPSGRVSPELVKMLAKENLSLDSLMTIFKEIESGEQRLRHPLKIAYLGPEATFTHQATVNHFGHGATINGLDGIPDVFDAVCKQQVDYGVVPVENSTEGAVRVTFDLFPSYDVSICAEVLLPVHHNFLVRQNLDEITKLYSHRQVFGQCRNWISKNYPCCETVETASTAEAAALAAVSDCGAALGSELAAEKYNLEIRHRTIEDQSNNTTRFLVLGRKSPEPSGNDKTSIMFALKDQVGVLYEALLPFKEQGVSMSMIESRPSKTQAWEYVFFVDLEGHATDPSCAAALKELEAYCLYLKVLGSYPKAARPV